jgi:hypothetical protein
VHTADSAGGLSKLSSVTETSRSTLF